MPGVKMFKRPEEGRVAEDFSSTILISYIWTKEANLGVLDGRGVQRKILDWELPSVRRHRAVDKGMRMVGSQGHEWKGSPGTAADGCRRPS